MNLTNLQIGTEVRYPETFRGIRWVKVGTVVELGENGRVRVQWNRWEYPSGHVRPDGKRTWVKAAKLK